MKNLKWGRPHLTGPGRGPMANSFIFKFHKRRGIFCLTVRISAFQSGRLWGFETSSFPWWLLHITIRLCPLFWQGRKQTLTQNSAGPNTRTPLLCYASHQRNLTERSEIEVNVYSCMEDSGPRGESFDLLVEVKPMTSLRFEPTTSRIQVYSVATTPDPSAKILPPFIIQSVHYENISTNYVVGPKILQHSVQVLQGNIPLNILQSYVHVSVKSYLRKSGCYICWFEYFQFYRLFFFKQCGCKFVWVWCYFISVLDAEFCNFFSNCWYVPLSLHVRLC